MNNIETRELNEEEQKIALDIARKSILGVFENKKYEPKVDQYPIFENKRGVFVTLRIDEKLRGCIGTFDTNKSLQETIQEMVIAAAFGDSRFNSLNKKEFDKIKIEISVLYPKEKISDPSMVKVGTHGVYIQKGGKSGVYLPQVATEAGWNREQFLSHLCEYKAEIDKKAWQDKNAHIYIFKTQVFKE